jgi:hypothetical protein
VPIWQPRRRFQAARARFRFVQAHRSRFTQRWGEAFSRWCRSGCCLRREQRVTCPLRLGTFPNAYITFQLVDPVGKPLSPPSRLDAPTSSIAGYPIIFTPGAPKVAFSPAAGSWVVAYESLYCSRRQAPRACISPLFIALIGPDGHVLAQPRPVIHNLDADGTPLVACDRVGCVLQWWSPRRDAEEALGLSPIGVPTTQTPVRISSGRYALGQSADADSSAEHTIVTTADGYLVAWTTGSPFRRVLLQHLPSAGTRVGEEVVANRLLSKAQGASNLTYGVPSLCSYRGGTRVLLGWTAGDTFGDVPKSGFRYLGDYVQTYRSSGAVVGRDMRGKVAIHFGDPGREFSRPSEQCMCAGPRKPQRDHGLYV